mgnify:CR=1 FL=1
MFRRFRFLRSFSSEASNRASLPTLSPGWKPSQEFVFLVLGGGGLAVYVDGRADRRSDKLDTLLTSLDTRLTSMQSQMHSDRNQLQSQMHSDRNQLQSQMQQMQNQMQQMQSQSITTSNKIIELLSR